MDYLTDPIFLILVPALFIGLTAIFGNLFFGDKK